MTDTTTPLAPPKPGYRTTEFWLKIAAIALSALFASGAIPTSGPAAQITAIAATMLGALGYTVSRTLVKNGAAALLLVLALGVAAGSMSACATTGATVKAEATNVEGCSASDVVAILTASDKIKADFSNPDREAALIDGALQLAAIHAAWAHCKATAHPAPAPVPAPAAPATTTAALFCGTGCMSDNQCSEGTSCSKCVGNTCTTEAPLAPDRVADR